MTVKPKAKSKRDRLLELIAAGHGRAGIYVLARKAKRPYRRVHDAVKAFEAKGQVRLSRATGGRFTWKVELVASLAPPTLEFNRAYSAPGKTQPPETEVALVLAQPSFRDLLVCVDHYGAPFVTQVRERMLARGELGALTAQTTRTLLDDIAIGRQSRDARAVAA
jgi:hypothetical protein